jgi:histone acetyltransferase (RNA polymerase elongator complex component)
MEIRSRECGRNPSYSINSAILVERKYYTYNKGLEYFISYESPDKKCLFGFIRLRIPITFKDCVFPELFGCALIRELHVYGSTTPVGHTSE